MTTTKTSRTVRTKVYKFAGLTKEAQKKAIEWYKRTLDNDPYILNLFPEHCEEKAFENGFDIIDGELRYSLSYSQGDGLSFSSYIDIPKSAKEVMPGIKKSVLSVIVSNCEAKITANTGRYAFSSTEDVEFYLDAKKDYPNIEKTVGVIREYIEDQYMKLCSKLTQIGYEWLSDAYSDESAKSNIEANEYEFLKDGTRSPF